MLLNDAISMFFTLICCVNFTDLGITIKEKRYTGALENYIGEVLLIGISYDDNKGHSCVIEKLSN